MKRFFKSKIVGIATLAFGLAFLVGCGDDDSFSPVSGNGGTDDVESSDSIKSQTSGKVNHFYNKVDEKTFKSCNLTNEIN